MSSETTTMLGRFPLFDSATDLDDARDKVTTAMTSHLLTFAGRNYTLNARMNSCRIRDTSINWAAYGGDVRVIPGSLDTFYVVMIPLSGSAEIRTGKDRFTVGPGQASVISPMDDLQMRWSSDCSKLILRIEQTALEALLSETLGASLHRGDLRFQSRMDVTGGYTHSWFRMLRLMVEELERPGALIEVPAYAMRFEQHLMRLLLAVQPHNYTDELQRCVELMDRGRRAPQPKYVREAARLIDDHPEWEHTTTSLAAHVGYTERALQKGFKTHFGLGPSTYLRKARLHRVRDELLAASPDSVGVERIARRWGFTHHGHFARLYREEFGESPSQTLRR